MTIQNSKFKIHNAKLPRFSSVIAILRKTSVLLCHCELVEAQATMFHFPQAENSTCALASPLPTKAIRLCGAPFICRRGNLKKRFPRSLCSLGMTHRAKVPTKFRHSAFGIPALSFRPAVALHGLTVHILSVPIVVKQSAGHLAGAAAEQVRGQLPHHIARIQAL